MLATSFAALNRGNKGSEPCRKVSRGTTRAVAIVQGFRPAPCQTRDTIARLHASARSSPPCSPRAMLCIAYGTVNLFRHVSSYRTPPTKPSKSSRMKVWRAGWGQPPGLRRHRASGRPPEKLTFSHTRTFGSRFSGIRTRKAHNMTLKQHWALSKARTHLFIALKKAGHLRQGMGFMPSRRDKRLQKLTEDLVKHIGLANLMIEDATHQT